MNSINVKETPTQRPVLFALHHRVLILFLLLLAFVSNTSAQWQSVNLNSGPIQLGVSCWGNLSGCFCTNMWGRANDGLIFGGKQGVTSEGWGIAANDEFSGVPVCEGAVGGWWWWGALNLSLNSFSAPVKPDGSSEEATSIIDVTTGAENALEVTHTFRPMPSLPNLYRVDVTVSNMSPNGLTVRYRRIVTWYTDWNSPNPFTGMETLQRGFSSKLIQTDNSPNPPNPNALWSISFLNTDFVDAIVSSPSGLFDLDLGVLPPQESTSFSLYYGGFPDQASLDSALNTLGAEAYCSYGIPLDSTRFVQAWTGIGGGATGIKSFAPAESGNGLGSSHVLIQVSGRGFAPTAKLKLRNGANTIIGATSQSGSATVTAAGFQISDSFDLRAAAFGGWNVVVENSPGVEFVSPTLFTIRQDIPIVEVGIVGPEVIAAGRLNSYTLSCKNSGELLAENIVVTLAGISASVSISEAGSSYVVSTYPVEPDITLQKVTFAPLTVLPGDEQFLYVSLTAPGGTPSFTLLANAEGTTNPDTRVSSPPPKNVAVVWSWDPNDKTGVSGVGAGRFIKGNESLDYQISFENKSAATAPAQEVFITDRLDIASYDLGSFALGPFAFAGMKVVPPSGLKTFTRDVPFDIDGDPATTEDNVLVRITAHLVTNVADPDYGLFTCDFRTIDPITGELPANPLIGFLKPNNTPPEGDGSVIFNVRAKSSLQDGHVIANGASIVFDLNSEILTPVWANTIDKIKPSSRVSQLPAVHYSPTFDLNWTGLDTGSGIQSYSVYVSENDGPFTVWLNHTTLTSASFTGEMGKAYKFYSVAKDQVGNIEDAPLIPDAATSIQDPGALTVAIISGPVNPLPVSGTITLHGRFAQVGGSHIAVWNWGDGFSSAGTVSEVNGSGYVSGTHTYVAAGVYTVNLTVSDETGLQTQATFRYVVIFDPNGGFVTGGGWINSPAGAYAPNPLATGKATFGFNSQYKKGANVPTGQTQFTFHTAGMDFHSANYEWLVVSGAKARYKGSGTINRGGDYGFILIATDGQVAGGGGKDKFRIKIWDKANGHRVVYDNQLGAPEDADPTTVLGGGSIVIQKDK